MSTPPDHIAPSWPYCAHGTDAAADPVGCRGSHVPGHTACLAHLSYTDRDAYLVGLAPGADVDHRGTPFTEDLLRQLLRALSDPITRKPQMGTAKFSEARFTGNAEFDKAQFSGNAEFDEAQFTGYAVFHGAQFSGDARFHRAKFSNYAGFRMVQFTGYADFGRAEFHNNAEFDEARFPGNAGFDGAQFSGHIRFGSARFSGHAGFDGAQFSGGAVFGEAQFSGRARFRRARFSGHAGFDEAQFYGDTEFGGAQFSSGAGFGRARFVVASELGPFVCAGVVDLSRAVFEDPVTLEIAARKVLCKRTRWESTATVRLRYATADFEDAVLSAPVAVTAHPTCFTAGDDAVEESSLPHGCDCDGVRVASVQGVDAAHLVLIDTDLTDCLFFGAFHLDQIHLEGHTVFAPTPTGWHRRGIRPTRWTRRRTLAEEHHCRPAITARDDPRQWRPRPHDARGSTPKPQDVAALYRQLRKALEDGKNEPGAADFYYGECEMRRHDDTATPKGERRILWGYWLLSGYGLRASRAFTWLFAAMSLTVLLLMGVGLPTHDPDPATTGTLHGNRISLSTSTPDPAALHGTWSQRMTWARAEKATRAAVNSVIFRSSGQNLTSAGTYIEMVSRLLEPTLIALGALAVRGRIKR
ncbi:pentapeptide repeat-containing protein [Streptomyces sp. NPDC059679]|uniref:pentapeptide repeat-containing protein n=1 Tax=Streptomyces sp. NPDC059679 TaxID=3346903 RepID=UPI0036990CBB